jgi:ATP-dependent DNA helicase RecQ
MHPVRRDMAARGRGEAFDRLQATAQQLLRGEGGTDKPLSCDAALLRRIVKARPSGLDQLARVPGMTNQRMDRFGRAFLAALGSG